jgi:GNAT superfamily N-acetyltransferase
VRCSFDHNPEFSSGLFELLEIVFPGLGRTAENARRLGAAWESVSTPYVHFEDGRPVSHIGVIGLPLVVVGREVVVGSVHAVATHPEHRKRGHYGRLMNEVIRDTAGRYETLILTTENPEYYEPFGFRIVEEHAFRIRCGVDPAPVKMRILDLDAPADIAILQRLLASREPVSRVVGVVRETAIFYFNEGRRPLHYAEDLDAIVCLESEGGSVALFDVVATRLPALEDLIARLPVAAEEVVANFALDRFAPDAVASRRILDHDGPSYLMVRGPFAAEAHAFTLPRSART